MYMYLHVSTFRSTCTWPHVYHMQMYMYVEYEYMCSGGLVDMMDALTQF